MMADIYYISPESSLRTSYQGLKSASGSSTPTGLVENYASPSHVEAMNMSDLSREELDAKLAAAEARTEASFAALSGKIDRLSDLITISAKQLSADVDDVKTELREVKTDNKFTRWTIIVTVIGATLAALAALWTTQGNLVSAFSAGIAAKSSISSSQQSTRP